ncbi:unnamed protein product [Sphagnum troendelagicum]
MLSIQVIKHGLPAVIDISTGRESRSAASQRRLILYGSPAMKIVLTQSSSSSRNSIVTLAATRPRPARTCRLMRILTLQQGCKLICLPAGDGSLRQASYTVIAGGSYSKAAAHAYSSSTAAVDPGIRFPVNLSGHYNHLVIPPRRPIP